MRLGYFQAGNSINNPYSLTVIRRQTVKSGLDSVVSQTRVSLPVSGAYATIESPQGTHIESYRHARTDVLIRLENRDPLVGPRCSTDEWGSGMSSAD